MQIQHILFPVDFSGRSEATAPFIYSLAQRYNARITLLHAIPPLPLMYFDSSIPEPDLAASAVDTRLRKFGDKNFPHCEITTLVACGQPAREILTAAKEIGADLIAMPTHGYRALRRFLLGSVTATVLRDSEIPVWTSAHVCDGEHRAHPQPRRIIAALDLKQNSEKTMRTALDLARDIGATVEVLHVAPEGTISSTTSEAIVQRTVAAASGGGSVEVECAPFTELQITVSGEGIASMIRRVAAQHRADLIVTGRGSIHGHILDRVNSHAYAVICEAPCPVLSV